jgi:hypothetical protein
MELRRPVRILSLPLNSVRGCLRVMDRTSVMPLSGNVYRASLFKLSMYTGVYTAL